MSQTYSFFNDYSEGAHPDVLKILQETNMHQEMGYGEDSLTIKATELIKKELGSADAEVYFVSGGTQANLTVLGSMLKSYESVIALETAHISVHETGAIEATGHKINMVVGKGGKITPEQIETVVQTHTDEHMVKPKVVFISQSTEVGTIYSLADLTALSHCCKKNNLYLYCDGARLGSALASVGNDVTLKDLASLTDAFYIGGTKNGALLGEAIVLCNPHLQKDFRYHIKQRGGLLAKGRLISTQFIALFENNLYIKNARHANTMAKKLADSVRSFGYKFLTESHTNQIFPILPNTVIAEMKKKYGFYVWKKIDENQSVIRLVTSWATLESAVDAFVADLQSLSYKK